MDRLNSLLSLIPEEAKELTTDVVKEIIFLEGKLNSLKELPFIKVNPNNPEQQKNTPAAKMYKEFLQQYINCIKVIEGIIYKDKRLEGEEIEESPLRKWFNANQK